jgi:hypothetical protein
MEEYRKEILRACVTHCVGTSGSLDIICRPWAATINRWAGRESSVDGLPSWIPSFVPTFLEPSKGTRKFNRINGDSLVGPPDHKVYNASSTMISMISFSHDSVAMRVKGFRLGTIRSSLPPATGGMIWKEALEMAGLDEDFGALDTVPDKLWLTLVADQGPNGSPVPNWYHRACLYCLEHATRIGDGDIDTAAYWRPAPLPS